MWKTFYLNDTNLKQLCESPEQLRIPVGSCVHVRKGHGYLFNNAWYRALPGYVTESNIPVLNDICGRLRGYELVMSEEPLSVKEWRRGWVDEYYPLSDNPVFKCYLPGMYRVHLKLVDKDMIRLSLDTYKYIPVCPTCTLDQYEDTEYRKLFDESMRCFINQWLYGGKEGGELRD